jgi:hypothetical protein
MKMARSRVLCCFSGLVALAACGSDGSALRAEQEAGHTTGRLTAGERALEYSAASDAPGIADVQLGLDALRFRAHFDYRAGVVVIDGYGAALDRGGHHALLEAATALAQELGASSAVPFEQQALYAAVVAWHETSGVALSEKRFVLRSEAGADSAREKSLLDDGVGCVTRGETYAVSFDHGRTTVLDEPVTADVWECNGLCGPYCVALTPWRMWTLDCLEHDQCCRATDTPDCWAPLGECGDEYEAAIADFLRGFDPFAAHCEG